MTAPVTERRSPARPIGGRPGDTGVRPTSSVIPAFRRGTPYSGSRADGPAPAIATPWVTAPRVEAAAQLDDVAPVRDADPTGPVAVTSDDAATSTAGGGASRHHGAHEAAHGLGTAHPHGHHPGAHEGQASRAEAAVRSARSAVPFVVLIAGMLSGGVVLSLVLQTQVAVNAFEAQSVDRQLTSLRLRESALRSEIVARDSPAAIADQALRQGLVPANAGGVLNVGTSTLKRSAVAGGTQAWAAAPAGTGDSVLLSSGTEGRPTPKPSPAAVAPGTDLPGVAGSAPTPGTTAPGASPTPAPARTGAPGGFAPIAGFAPATGAATGTSGTAGAVAVPPAGTSGLAADDPRRSEARLG